MDARAKSSSARFRGGLAVVALASLVLLPNLGGYALWDPDEARHAEVAREMLVAPSWTAWIVPSFNFRPYYHKPILFYWAACGVGTMIGLDERAVRLVSAVAAVGTLLAVAAWAAHVWDVAAGLTAALVLLTAVEFAGLGRHASLDMLLTCWVTSGMLAFHRWIERPVQRRWLWIAGAAAGLGALAKGLVAPALIGVVALLTMGVTRRVRSLDRHALVIPALACFAVAGPWYAAAGISDPAYLREFILHHHLDRFLGNASEFHQQGAHYPLVILFAGFLPWTFVLPAALRGTLTADRRSLAAVFCACWGTGVIGFFMLSKGKLGTYVLPAFPPLALLTGRYLSTLRRRPMLPPAEERLMTAAVMALAAASLLAGPACLAVAERFGMAASAATDALALGGTALGLLLIGLLRARRWDIVPVAVGGGMLVALGIFYRWGAPLVSGVLSAKPLAEVVATARDEMASAPIVGYSVRGPSLIFYLQRPVRDVITTDGLARTLAENPFVWVVTNPRHEADVLASGTLYLWYRDRRRLLYASEPPVSVVRRLCPSPQMPERPDA